MPSVSNAFERFVSALELTDPERDRAKRQKEVVRENVRGRLEVKRDIISGSYSRNTAIRPLNDIDLFFILDEEAHADLRESPQACLKAVQDALAEAYPNKEEPKLQKRSVNIEFSGTGIGYDVVPAFDDGIPEGEYEIPDVDSDTWIRTNPEEHKRLSIEANKRAENKLKPLIKAAKHWNREAGKLLPSFHLDVMSWSVFTAGPASYPEGLFLLFDALSSAVMLPCPDPAGLGPDIDHGMTDTARTSAHKALKEAARHAKVALRLDTEGLTEEAHYVWRQLLGSVYPEAGKAPSADLLRRVSMGYSTGLNAPDHKSNRFG